MTRNAANAPSTGDLEDCYVMKVAQMMECHHRFIGSMPEVIARNFITELLLDKPW